MVRRIFVLLGGFAVLAFLTGIPPAAAPVVAAPSNDNFANAITIVATATDPVVASGSNSGATTETGEPTSCSAGATVWYNWTSPPFSGTIALDTYGSDFDTVLGIYTGSTVNALTEAGCNDDFGDLLSRRSGIAFSFAASTMYRIQVGGFIEATGNFVLNLSLGASIVVNTDSDNATPDGVLSLREAMLAVKHGSSPCAILTPSEQTLVLNCGGGGIASADLIHFSPSWFPPGAPLSIPLMSSLPTMLGGDTISGIGAGVVIDGQINAVDNCFTINGSYNRIQGLDIRRCGNDGIVIIGGSSNVIGVDTANLPVLPQERNIIREIPNGNGVRMIGAGAGNMVYGNYIGTNEAGAMGLGNGTGVAVEDSSYQVIGSAGAGRNVISGNVWGVFIGGNGPTTSNTVAGNLIGTDAAETAAVPNTVGVQLVGATGSTIGGNSPGLGNVISGNADDGVRVSGILTHSNTIVGNYIGVSSAGADLGNGGDGIQLLGASSNTIGGESVGARNVISGNTQAGINVIGEPRVVRSTTPGIIAPISDLSTINVDIPVAFSNPIVDVDVEVDITHQLDADLDIFLVPPTGPSIELTTDNGGFGQNYSVTVFDDEAATAVVDGTAPFNGSFRPESPLSALDGLSPQGTWFLQVTDDAAGDTGSIRSWSLKFAVGGNRVLGNYIGTNADGTVGIYNNRGVALSSGAQLNTIGGLSPGARNVISGNNLYGVQIEGSMSTDNVVQGNYIGTATSGTAPVGNLIGVHVLAPRNRIGGTAPGARNVISGNATSGIAFEGSSTELNVVEGNYIGVAADGVTPAGNGFYGVVNNGSTQTIGGTAPGSGNLIAYNGQGISLQADSNNVVFGNTIRNNINQGIIVFGTGGNQIGGTLPGAGNVISANGSDGVLVTSRFGGTQVIGNSIYGNLGDGVGVENGVSNRVVNNSISGNGELGIDLGPDGVTQNDPGDGDIGANGLQNYPVLTDVKVIGGDTYISGSLDSIANESFTISFFQNNSCDDSGHGEGEVVIGSWDDIPGNTSFALLFQVAMPPGRFITATATRANTLDTSEFSNCVPSLDDADDDDDGFPDTLESACGSKPMNPSSVPERIDGNYFDVDDDRDSLFDEALPAGAANFDCDRDGYKGSAEDRVFSYLAQTNGDQKTCQEYDASFPNAMHKPSKRWPSDLDSSSFSLNKINIVDLASFIGPIRYLNQNVGTDPSDVRYDLVPGAVVGFDINVSDMAALVSGPSGFPPMLGNAKAFNGPVCPYLP